MSLKLEHIRKSYDKTVLQDVNCELTEGIYGVLGLNGAGKSTLLRIICGTLIPDSGQVLYEGSQISSLGERYRDILGYVPQRVGYYPEFTARTFLEYMSVLKGIREQDRRSQVDEVLELMGLADTGKKKIKNFSGGMKQRLGIAQAVLGHPRLLVLDEPAAGLDIRERANFKEFIQRYARGRIVLYATHVVSEIEDIATEMLLLETGELKRQECASPVVLDG